MPPGDNVEQRMPAGPNRGHSEIPGPAACGLLVWYRLSNAVTTSRNTDLNLTSGNEYFRKSVLACRLELVGRVDPDGPRSRLRAVWARCRACWARVRALTAWSRRRRGCWGSGSGSRAARCSSSSAVWRCRSAAVSCSEFQHVRRSRCAPNIGWPGREAVSRSHIRPRPFPDGRLG